jgi:hypothetical protein
MGHYGATGGTLTEPTGPLANLADGVSNVDAVIGDHTDFQVLATRSNGVLVTENRSKGLRFTRVRLVLAPGKGVVYKTADFHKPWNIGVTPDAAIQARIDELNAALLPILGTQVGDSNVAIPRPTRSGRNSPTVRACESPNRRRGHGRDASAVRHGLRYPNPADSRQHDLPAGGQRRTLPGQPVPVRVGPLPDHARGGLTVLPFGNQSATANVVACLKEFLGRRSHRRRRPAPVASAVPGLCVRYNIEAPAKRRRGRERNAGTGSRVTTSSAGRRRHATSRRHARRADGSGSLHAHHQRLHDDGDGYPNVRTSGHGTARPGRYRPHGDAARRHGHADHPGTGHASTRPRQR